MMTRTFSQPFAQNLLTWLRRLLPLIVIVAVLVVLNRVQQEAPLTVDETRPVVAILAAGMSVFIFWSAVHAAAPILANADRFAWRMSFRFIGWIGAIGAILGIAVLLLSKDSDPRRFPLAGVERAVEFIIPLAVGLQCAFIFSPDDEPGIEVLLACPRPISWLLLERLLALTVLQTGIALTGSALSYGMNGGHDPVTIFLRWISPALFLGGIGVYTTWRSRQPAFGVAVVGLLWFIFAFLGMVFMPGAPTFWPLSLIQPFLWSLYSFLRPEDLASGDYIVNRVLLGAIGLLLILLAARQMQDTEAILTNGKSGRPSKGN